MKKINHKKYLKEIHELEQRFEKLHISLQILIMLYVAVSTVVFGIILGTMMYGSSIRDLKNINAEKIRTEQNSINNLLKTK